MKKTNPQKILHENSCKKWREVTVGDVAEYHNGHAFKPDEWGDTGRPIIRIQNLTGTSDDFNYSTKKIDPKLIVEPGDLLVSWSATLDAFVWNGPEGLLNQHIFKVVPNTKIVDKKFLYWGLKVVIQEMWESEKTHGTTMKHINREPFLTHRFPLPPLPTQRRIATRLDALTTRADRARDHLEEIPNLVDNFRKSLLARAFTGELTADWRADNPDVEPASQLLERIKVERKEKWIHNYAKNLADRARKRNEKKGKTFTEEDWQAYYDKKTPQGEDRYEEPEPVDPDEEDLPEIPETWEWVRLESLMTYGPRNGYSPKTGSDAEGVQVLRLSATTTGQLILNDETTKQAYEELPDESPYYLEQGDILVQRGNTIEYLGATAVYNGPSDTYIYPDLMMCFRVPGQSLTKYVANYLNSPRARKYIRENATGSAGSMPKINQTILRSIRVPVPPNAEQKTIVHRISEQLKRVSTVEQTIAEQRERTSQLESSLISTTLNPSEPTTTDSR